MHTQKFVACLHIFLESVPALSLIVYSFLGYEECLYSVKNVHHSVH